MNETDKELLEDVLEFNKYDLYSKNDSTNINEETKKYSDDLLKNFFPTPLKW